MKRHTKSLAAVSAVALLGLLGAGTLDRADAAPPPPIDVTNHRVVCDTLVGKLKFSAPLVIGGTTPNTISISATLDGCVDQTDSNVQLKATKLKGTLSSNTNDCLSLVGPTSVTGTVQVKWKTVAGAPKIDDDDPTVAGAVSDITVSQANGATYAAPSSWGNGAASGYGLFQIGADAAHGNTIPPSVDHAFQGTDGGLTSTFDGTTGESVNAIFAKCLSTGVKQLNFGIGALYLA